jgi:hypothetical protein
MTAAIAYILFAVTSNAMPDLTALAAFDTRDACQAAAGMIADALAKGEDGKHLICIASDSLDEMAKKNLPTN